MKIQLTDVKNLAEYEKVREAERARIIALKRSRRIGIGENLTLLFENRETVLFQIHEMTRTERIVDEARIQDEIDAYAPPLPGPGELSATLFIEIPELPRMSQEQVRETVNRFQGLDRDGILLEIGPYRIPARFESGHSKEEKMAAVHYVRFPVSAEARAALGRSSERVRLVADHPNYRGEAEVSPETRAVLLADLAS
jgi:hypothetical protein